MLSLNKYIPLEWIRRIKIIFFFFNIYIFTDRICLGTTIGDFTKKSKL